MIMDVDAPWDFKPTLCSPDDLLGLKREGCNVDKSLSKLGLARIVLAQYAASKKFIESMLRTSGDPGSLTEDEPQG